MDAKRLVVVTYCDESHAQDAIRELRRVGFRADQLVIALSQRRSDRTGLLTHALRKHGATIATCTVCESLFADGHVVIAVRSQSRSRQSIEVVKRNGGEVQFDGDADPGHPG